MAPMPSARPLRRHRTFLTLDDIHEQLVEEAARKGLRLATYLRELIVTHPERARGAAHR